jgi:acylphosphatase
MATEARLFTVHGRVQGVWFRDSTRREAMRLGIAGYAINLSDGTVEVLACGASNALDELAGWLQSGPPMASVTRVDVHDADADETEGFRIG